MNQIKFKSNETNRVLFVWDGSNSYVREADQFSRVVENVVVHAVHVMPHESIYGYGAINQEAEELTSTERRLYRAFDSATRTAPSLDRSRFEILFGERVSEIVRVAEVMKVKFILLPPFQQSSFSRWIHGDLNERIAKKAHCPVMFLESGAMFTRNAVEQAAAKAASIKPTSH